MTVKVLFYSIQVFEIEFFCMGYVSLCTREVSQKNDESVLKWLCLRANSSAAAHWKKCTFPVLQVCRRTEDFSLSLLFCLMPELSLQFIHTASAILFLKIPVISPSPSTLYLHLSTLFWTPPRSPPHAMCRTNTSNTKEKQCRAVSFAGTKWHCAYEKRRAVCLHGNLKEWKIWTV